MGRTLRGWTLLGLLALGGLGWTQAPQLVQAAGTPAGSTLGVRDDRAVLQTFLRQGAIPNRRLSLDLDRTAYSPDELRAALQKVYSVRVEQVSAFLDSQAGQQLIWQQVQGWSPGLNPRLKVYGLRAAILEASRQDALSLAGVVARLPVRFDLPNTAAEARWASPDQVCPAQCGDSVLAHLAFLMASLQAGAMGR